MTNSHQYVATCLHAAKCQFCKTEVEYLGHIISTEGLKPINKTVQKIKSFLVPRTPTDVKSFLGLVGYYRRFIPRFAMIAHPLNQLLQKNVRFEWKQEHQTAFEQLRDSLADDVILAYPRFDEPFIVATDASNVGIGGVLSQITHGKERPIAFYSRALRKYEKNYTISEKEALAVVATCKAFDVYLHNQPFTLHNPLH